MSSQSSHHSSSTSRRRRNSRLTSSDAKTDSLPVDCILVYNYDEHDDNERKNDREFRMSPSERRRTFEEYLVRKQGLILEHHVCRK